MVGGSGTPLDPIIITEAEQGNKGSETALDPIDLTGDVSKIIFL